MAKIELDHLTELAALIRDARQETQDAASRTASLAVDVGHYLVEAKTAIGDDRWAEWLHEHVGMSVRVAQQYMRLVR